MDKLKQAISRGKDKDEPEATQGSTAKAGGQGSHFASARSASSTYPGNENLGSTTTGSTPPTTGASDASAATPDPSLARNTAGPEAGGQSHIGTISSEAAGTTARDDGGATAIGTTSTYSTTHLTKGDPTSSVIDAESTDPITYKKPEATSHARDTGVPEGSAQTAASKAFKDSKSHNEGMPGAYPTATYENPYKASNLDPRVDNLPIRGSEEAPASSASHTLGTTAAGAGAAGLATAGAAAAVSGHDKSRQTTGPAPSTLTSTANPADRSAEYTQAEKTRMPEAAATTAMSPQGTTAEPQQPSMVGRVLGAVGLGSLAGAGAAAATKSGGDSAVDTSEGPITTTGTDSYRSPSLSGPPPSHHRKESIPTTAYPAGLDSAKPIAPPIGGTRPLGEQSTTVPASDDHLGRNAAIGTGVLGAGAGAAALGTHEVDKSHQPTGSTLNETGVVGTSGGQPGLAQSQPSQVEAQPEPHHGRDAAVVGAGVVGVAGAGAVGAHEYETSRALREGTTGERSMVPTSTVGTTAVPPQYYDESKNLRQGTTAHDATTLPSAVTSEGVSAIPREDEKEDHTVRNTALAGAAGVGAAGAGAYAVNDHSKELAEKEAARQGAEHQKEMARQQKEVEKQQAAQAKHAEKEHKAAEKEHAKEEKAMAKEQKKAEKEADKEDRQREKELAAAGAGAGAVGAGGAAYAADKNVHEATTKDGEPLEKKPSLLRRIFKRKNKDTGEDEEYEAEEEDKDLGGAAVAGTGAAGAGTYAATQDDRSGALRSTSAEQQPISKYEEKTGGFIKPSYNPFTRKDEPEGLAGTADINHQNTGRTGEPISHSEGKEEVPVAGPGAGGTTAVRTGGSFESTEGRHERNKLHKDPPADHPAATTLGQSASGTEHDEHGEEHHRGFREKIKEKLGLSHPESDHSNQETRQAL